jgi:digeranylgeranylglycerophospholipid reductase
MSSCNYDVVVVGAGPAGTSTAETIAAAGHKVLILEEHSKVGFPVHCSGLVTPRTVRAAEVGEELIDHSIIGATIHGVTGSNLNLGGDHSRAVVLDRAALDQSLAERAQNKGSELWLGSRLQTIQRENGHLELGIRQGSKDRAVSVRTRLLVGADGWNSFVARWMGRKTGNAIATMSVDARVTGHPPDMAQVFVARDTAPGWFGWSIPLGETRVRVGVGCDPSVTRRKPRHFLGRLIETHPQIFQNFRPISYSGGYIPLYENNGSVPTYGDNLLLVGDAARQVKPTSGGGIFASIVIGRKAAKVALAALEADDLSSARLAVYEKDWRGDFEQEFVRGLELRRLYTNLSDNQVDLLLKVLATSKLQRIVRHYGDIDFPSTMFARLALASPIVRSFVSLTDVVPIHWLGILRKGVRWLRGVEKH